MYQDEPTGNATLDELLAKHFAIWGNVEFNQLADKKKVVRTLNNRWDTRRYSKLGLHILQGWADSYIVRRLRETIPEYNQALRDYRQKHQVTPVPMYMLPEVDEERVGGCRVRYSTLEGNLTIARFLPLNKVAQLSPAERQELLIIDQEWNDANKGHYCGFCGETARFNPQGEEKEQKPFTLPMPSFIGFRPDKWVCGEEKCTEMAIPNYIRDLQLQGSMNDFGLAIGAAMMGRGTLTPVQADYLREQAVQRIMERMTSTQPGGK